MSDDIDPFDDFEACQDFVASYVLDNEAETVDEQPELERESFASEDSSQRTDSPHESTRVKRTKDEIRIAKNQRRNAANKRRRALIVSQLKNNPVRAEPTSTSSSASTVALAPVAAPATTPSVPTPQTAFPSFANVDSLAFLPLSLVEHMNCGDFSTVRSLLAAHVSTRCTADHDAVPMSVETFVNVFESFQDMYPDVILFVREGKVAENTICATLLTKYTETSYLYDNVIDSLHHKFPTSFPLLARRDRWMRKMHSNEFSVQDVLNAMSLIDQRKTLVVQGKLEWVFTFTGSQRRICRISSMWELTSLSCVPEIPGDVRSPL